MKVIVQAKLTVEARIEIDTRDFDDSITIADEQVFEDWVLQNTNGYVMSDPEVVE